MATLFVNYYQEQFWDGNDIDQYIAASYFNDNYIKLMNSQMIIFELVPLDLIVGNSLVITA